MLETDSTLALLHSLADVGVTPADRDVVRDRVQVAVAAEFEPGAGPGAGWRVRGPRARWGPIGGAFALGLSVLVVVAVAVGAVALVAHRGNSGSTAPAAPAS